MQLCIRTRRTSHQMSGSLCRGSLWFYTWFSFVGRVPRRPVRSKKMEMTGNLRKQAFSVQSEVFLEWRTQPPSYKHARDRSDPFMNWAKLSFMFSGTRMRFHRIGWTVFACISQTVDVYWNFFVRSPSSDSHAICCQMWNDATTKLIKSYFWCKSVPARRKASCWHFVCFLLSKTGILGCNSVHG